MKKVLKIIGNIFTVFLIIIIILSAYSMFEYRRNPNKTPSVLGFKVMSVLSGSMRPYLEPGDMIVDKKIDPAELMVGDIITYRIGRTLVTHRVVQITSKDGQTYFQTKGDANNVEDEHLIRESQIEGRLLFKIPYGGYFAQFVRSLPGFILFVILPIVVFIGLELKDVLAEIGKEQKKAAERQDSMENINQ